MPENQIGKEKKTEENVSKENFDEKKPFPENIFGKNDSNNNKKNNSTKERVENKEEIELPSIGEMLDYLEKVGFKDNYSLYKKLMVTKLNEEEYEKLKNIYDLKNDAVISVEGYLYKGNTFSLRELSSKLINYIRKYESKTIKKIKNIANFIVNVDPLIFEGIKDEYIAELVTYGCKTLKGREKIAEVKRKEVREALASYYAEILEKLNKEKKE